MVSKEMFALGSKRSVIREIFEYGKKRKEEVGEENVFDFSLGNPSVSPPKEVDDTIKMLIDTTDSSLLHGYTSAPGEIEVRKAVASYLNTQEGANFSFNHIYMTSGAAASLMITLKALVEEGDEIIVIQPFFTEYKVFVESAGGLFVTAKAVEPALQPDLNDLRYKINQNTKAVIINSPNNPSGVVYSKDTIEGIVHLLEEKQREYNKQIFIISDEPYRELVYDNIVVPFIPNYYKNTVVCYSFSKSLSLPGERIGYIAVNSDSSVADEVFFAVQGAGRALGYVCASSTFQRVIAKCLGKTSDISVYKRNRDLLLETLVGFGYSVVRPDGAFYLFIKSPEESSVEFCERAKKYDILIVPGDDFGSPGYARLAYCVRTEQITRAFGAFKKLIESYK